MVINSAIALAEWKLLHKKLAYALYDKCIIYRSFIGYVIQRDGLF